MRVVLAFGVAPLVTPGVVWFIWTACRYLHIGWIGRMTELSSESSLRALYLPAIVAYGITLIGAVPGYLRLARRSALSVGRLLALGCVLGGAPFVLLAGSGRWVDFAIWLAMGAGSGAAAAALFSLIVLSRTADAGAS